MKPNFLLNKKQWRPLIESHFCDQEQKKTNKKKKNIKEVREQELSKDYESDFAVCILEKDPTNL